MDLTPRDRGQGAAFSFDGYDSTQFYFFPQGTEIYAKKSRFVGWYPPQLKLHTQCKTLLCYNIA